MKQTPRIISSEPMMTFAPLPANDFVEFIETYYKECRLQMPQIEAIAGKWTFEDLLPGMSDFDTRFICANSMTADDWCKMSVAVGQVHLDLCKSHPEWTRILEHLPGINITWDELTDEITYYPEYKQWSFYHCSNPFLLKQSHKKLAQRPWDIKDEYFHLKKFLYYYGQYNRTIDPPVNLGLYENRYPLHSRLMHYFTPAIQSAISILKHEAVIGKMQSLLLARKIFLQDGIFDEVIEIVQKNYEVPNLYEEPALSELEKRLFEGLKLAASQLSRVITILPNAHRTKPEDWKLSLKQVVINPSLVIFDNAKFARLMKGRLYFYVNTPSYFDSIWLIQNELERMGNNFFRFPFQTFWEITRGEKIEDPADIVPKIAGEILNEEEVRCIFAFDRLTRTPYQEYGKEVAKKIIDIYDGFFRGLYKISEKVKELQKRDASKNENHYT